VVSDLDRRRVVEVLDGRSRRRIERYLRSLPEHDRRAIEVVSIDPYHAYRQAIRAELPHARIVCDRFHLVRGANMALGSIRRERQRRHGRRRPKGTRRSGKAATWQPELYHAATACSRPASGSANATADGSANCSPATPILAEAWGLKEAFRAVYRATNRQDAERRLDHFLTAVDRAHLPAFKAFAHGVRQWRTELLAYFDEPTTNGYAEGVINKVKVIKRRAYGLPAFGGFRDRVLLACG
jgi:transposase